MYRLFLPIPFNIIFYFHAKILGLLCFIATLDLFTKLYVLSVALHKATFEFVNK